MSSQGYMGAEEGALQRTIGLILCANGDPLVAIDRAIAADPGAGSPHVLRAAVGVLAKDVRAFPLIRSALDAAAGDDRLRPREFEHLEAAHSWLQGEPEAAAREYQSILERWPRDLLALRLAQSCNFFLGDHRSMCDVVDLAAPAWSPGDPGFGYVLAMSAFAHAETGDAELAEALGRQALSIEPACPYGVHAVAHAYLERGEYRCGAEWMKEQEPYWNNDSRMLTHNAWHLALFELESGRFESAVEIFDRWLLPGAADSPLDAADATGLLWRLERRGWLTGDRWASLSDCWNASLGSAGFWPYLDLHAFVAFHAAGHPDRAQRLQQAVSACANGCNAISRRARTLTLPGLEAMGAVVSGTRAGPEDLACVRTRYCEFGGSRAQLDIFFEGMLEPVLKPEVGRDRFEAPFDLDRPRAIKPHDLQVLAVRRTRPHSDADPEPARTSQCVGRYAA